MKALGIGGTPATAVDQPPARSTRSHTTRTLETALFVAGALSPTAWTPRQMASRRLPPLAWALTGAFALEPVVVNLVLDQDTGKLLKYRQLLSHPKLKED